MEYNDKKIIYFFSIILLFFNYSVVLNIIFLLIITLISIFTPLKNNLLIFIFLIPFGSLLVIDGVGSIYRVIQLIIIIKYLIMIINRKSELKFTFFQYLIITVLFLYSIFEVFIYHNIIGFTVLINVLIMAMHNELHDRNQLLNNVYTCFLYSVISGIVYGLVHQNFMDRWVEGIGYIKQFNGTYEPNFMALYINIGIIIILTNKYSTLKKIIGLLVLYFGLIITFSLSGMILNLISVISIFFLYSLEKKYLLRNIKYVFIYSLPALFISFFVVNTDLFYPVKRRVLNTISNLIIGNYSKATSSRTDLANLYIHEWNQLSIVSKTFGMAHFSFYNFLKSKTTLSFLQYSHNSYLDMLFTFGVIWTVIIAILIVSNTFIEYIRDKDVTLFTIRVCVLIAAFNLSAFTSKVFYFWFII